jgi:hypothetical protein
MVLLKSPQQFVGFAVTLAKIFEFETLRKDTPLAVLEPDLQVKNNL